MNAIDDRKHCSLHSSQRKSGVLFILSTNNPQSKLRCFKDSHGPATVQLEVEPNFSDNFWIDSKGHLSRIMWIAFYGDLATSIDFYETLIFSFWKSLYDK